MWVPTYSGVVWYDNVIFRWLNEDYIESKQAYSCGINTSGQLGLGHMNSPQLDMKLIELKGIVKLAAGYNHSIALKGIELLQISK